MTAEHRASIVTGQPRAFPLTIPNLLSASRIAVAPAELWAAWTGREHLFLALFVYVLLSDAIDGRIARRSGTASPLGATLDSWGDFAMFLSLPPCVWWLWPDIVRAEALFITLAVLSYIVPTIIGYLRWHRLTSYHTWAAKLSAVMMGVTVLVLLIWGVSLPFRLVVPLFMFSAVEDIAITFILRHWQPNVPSIRHALALRRAS